MKKRSKKEDNSYCGISFKEGVQVFTIKEYMEYIRKYGKPKELLERQYKASKKEEHKVN